MRGPARACSGRPAVLAAALTLAVATPASARQALLAAPPDDAHAFSVAVCQGQGACTIDSPNCTGTLIAPNLVLTARHCVDFGRQLAEDFCEATFLGMINTEETLVTLDPAPYAAGAAPVWIPAARILAPGDARACAGDLALIVLARSVPAAEATPAAVDLVTNLALDPPAEVAAVGRGWVDAALAEPLPGAYEPVVVDDGGLRRRVLERIPVRCVSDLDGACSVEDHSDPSGVFTATADSLLIGGSTLPGDSGAGILAQPGFTDGRPEVVAVASFGTWDGAGRANGAGCVRVARQRAFLVAGALEAAALAGTAPPAWALQGGGADPASGCACAQGAPGPVAVLPPLLLLLLALRRPGPRARRAAPARPSDVSCSPPLGASREVGTQPWTQASGRSSGSSSTTTCGCTPPATTG